MKRYNPFDIVTKFEEELCHYTKAKYAICVNSCTNALGLCFRWHNAKDPGTKITIPKYTYIGVPMAAKRNGLTIKFVDMQWRGCYNIGNTQIWDCAREFHNGMFYDNYGPDSDVKRYKCLSFHRTKILGHIHGGAILTNDDNFASWARKVRVDGRDVTKNIHEDSCNYLGEHCYMEPEIAAALLHKMLYIPLYNEPLPNSDYPDCSLKNAFK